MAEVAIAELHGLTNAPPITVPVSLPPTEIGKVELLTIWNEYIPFPSVYLPFELQQLDYIIFVIRPIDDATAKLRVWGLDLESPGGYPQSSDINKGVQIFRVAGVDAQTELSMTGYGRMKVFMAVYRGLAATDRIGVDQRGFAWNAARNQYYVNRAPIPYSAPEAKIATVTFANLVPQLSGFSYSPDHGHWTDVISADEYDIEPNRQVTLEFGSLVDTSPLEDLWVYSTGGWDPSYANEAYGGVDHYTFILMTQQVDYLPEDPGNPAPAGNAHLPIKGL